MNETHEFVPQYLYLELEIPEPPKKPKEDKLENYSLIIIDIFTNDKED